MDSLYAFLFVVALLLPLPFLVLVARRRGWSFRRLGAYILLAYGVLFPLIMASGLGIKGWRLGIVVLATTTGGVVSLLLWERVLEMGKEAATRRQTSSRD